MRNVERRFARPVVGPSGLPHPLFMTAKIALAASWRTMAIIALGASYRQLGGLRYHRPPDWHLQEPT